MKKKREGIGLNTETNTGSILENFKTLSDAE